jgi:DNA-binding XRE family transcriptional regulator
MRDYAGCAARGMTAVEAAAELGVSRQTIYQAAYKLGLRFRRQPPIRRQQYADCAARGLTQAETARELGVTRQSACMAAGRHGIKFRPNPKKGRTYGILTYLTPAQRDDYRTLMRHQYSRAEALAAIGRADLLNPNRAEGTEPCASS